MIFDERQTTFGAGEKRRGARTLPVFNLNRLLGGFLLDYPVRVDNELLRRAFIEVLITLGSIIKRDDRCIQRGVHAPGYGDGPCCVWGLAGA